MKHRLVGFTLIVDRFKTILILGLLATAKAQSPPRHHCEPWPQCMDSDRPSTGPTGPFTIGPYAPLQNTLWQIGQEALRRAQENSSNDNALPRPAPLPPDALPKLSSRYVPDKQQQEDSQAEQQRQLEKQLQEEQQEEEEQQRAIERQQRDRRAAQLADEAFRASTGGFLLEKDGWVVSDQGRVMGPFGAAD